MYPDNTADLELALSQARASIRPELLNSNSLPSLLRGHELAPPTLTPNTNPSTSSSAPSNLQTQSSFFTLLPPELRTLIYRFTFTSTSSTSPTIAKFCPVKSYTRGARGAAVPSAIPLLLSCKRIYNESLPHLYSTPTWYLLNSSPLILPAYIPLSNLGYIRHVILHYHCSPHGTTTASNSAPGSASTSDPLARYEWLGTWLALSHLPNLQTLDITIYPPDVQYWPAYAAHEHEFLRPLCILNNLNLPHLKQFTLRLRWPAPSSPGPSSLTSPSLQDNSLPFLPPACKVVREHEPLRMAESMRITMDRLVTDWPHRYCLVVGWEEDARRNPEEGINECWPIPSAEGRRKGFLRTYRGLWRREREEEEKMRMREGRRGGGGVGKDCEGEK